MKISSENKSHAGLIYIYIKKKRGANYQNLNILVSSPGLKDVWKREVGRWVGKNERE